MKNKLMYRAGMMTVEEDEEKNKRIRVSVSSDAPVLSHVYFNGEYQRAYEILDHSQASIDMSRAKDGLVIQDGHGGDQVGLMRVELKDGKLGGVIDFCSGERAQNIAADAAKGLRRNMSVGYQINSASYRLEGTKDGIPLVRAMSWTPYEASFVNVPADVTVGVGRSDTAEGEQADNPAITQEAAQVEVKEIRAMDAKEVAIVMARAAKCGMTDEVGKMVAEGKTRGEIEAAMSDKMAFELAKARQAPAASAPAPLGGDAKTEKKIVREYSLSKFIRNLSSGGDIGFEREVSQQVVAQFGHSGRGQGIVVPYAVFTGKRATSLTESGTTSYTVNVETMGGEFIDVLRPYSILPSLGVRVMSGLVGNVSIPKKTAAGAGYWVAEEADVTRLAPTLGQVALSPKTVGAACDVSHLLKMQSTPSADAMIRDDILKSIATKIESAVFVTGGAGSPTVITSASGINNPTVTGGTPTYAQILDFPGSILADGAQAAGQKWAISAAVWAKLAATYNDGTTKSYPVLDTVTQTLIGFPYLVSENVGTNAAFFGDWSQMILASWGGGIEINVDTSTLSLAGGTRIVGLQMVDFALRHGQAFAYNSSVSA